MTQRIDFVYIHEMVWSKYSPAFRFGALLLIVPFGVQGIDGQAVDEELFSLLASKNWSCRYTHKVNASHFSDGSVDPKRTLTIGRVRCEPSGPGKVKSFVVTCEALGTQTAPDLFECAKSTADTVDISEMDWGYSDGLASSKPGSRTDKYGRSCQYEFGAPGVLWRKKPDGKWNVACASPLKCTDFTKGPPYFLAVCDNEGWKTVNGKEMAVCPAANDCINNPIPIKHAYTQAEFAQFRARSKEPLPSAKAAIAGAHR